MIYYDLEIIKILLYRAPQGIDGEQDYAPQTISIGTEATDQITEEDAIQHAEDAQLEVLSVTEITTGYTDQIKYAVNRKAAANILYAVYQDVVAEDNPRWQYARKLEKQADKMIEYVNRNDDIQSIPQTYSQTDERIFSIEEPEDNEPEDRDVDC